jgi:hypothetical protein
MTKNMITKNLTVVVMKVKFFIVKKSISIKISLIKRSNILKICKLKHHKILRNGIISHKRAKAEETMIKLKRDPLQIKIIPN